MKFHNFISFDCFLMVARLNFDFRKFSIKLSKFEVTNLELRRAGEGGGVRTFASRRK